MKMVNTNNAIQKYKAKEITWYGFIKIKSINL